MIIGLAIGLASSLFTGLYVWNETAYERHLPDPDRTFRLVQQDLTPAGDHRATTPFPLMDALLAEASDDLVAATRLFNFQAKQVSFYIPDRDARFSETRFFFADSTYFEVFGGVFVSGDPQGALTAPLSLVMTESAARRFFGDQDPIGQSVRFEGRLTLTVTAVIRDPEPRSHLQADLLASFSSLNQMYVGGVPASWSWSAVWTYVRLTPSANDVDLAPVLDRIARDRQPEPLNRDRGFRLQPVRDIWLRSALEAEIRPVNALALVALIGLIGLSVLLIASVNSVNLAVAKAVRFQAQTSIRKILGASERQLLIHFMAETVLLTGMSLVVAFGLVIMGMPAFNRFGGTHVSWDALADPLVWGIALLSVMVVVLVSGLYPATHAAKVNPLDWLKSLVSRENVRVRDWLMAAQFAVALVLLAGADVVVRQVEAMKNAELGFEQEGVVVIPVANSRLIFFYEEFRARLASHSAIRAVTATNTVTGTGLRTFDYQTEGSASGPVSHAFQFVMPGFQDVFGIPVVAGRAFADTFATDATEAVMVNEAMVRHLGWESPEAALGKWVVRDDFRYRVIGVVRDFRASSLHGPIAPMMLEMPVPASIPTQIQYIQIRFNPADEAAVMAVLAELHAEFDPRRLFRPFLLRDELARQYGNETRLGWFTRLLSYIAVGVAALGLFGLVNEAAERRRKTLSIHRVLGAGTGRVVLLMTRRIALAMAAATLLALPVWWWGANAWLSGFDDRITLQVWQFGLPLLVMLLAAVAATAYQIAVLLRSKPVDALRHS